MLVLLYFNGLGYSPCQVAMLFLFYEVSGAVTNLFGGYLAARLGLRATLFASLGTQAAALLMLAVPRPAQCFRARSTRCGDWSAACGWRWPL